MTRVRNGRRWRHRISRRHACAAFFLICCATFVLPALFTRSSVSICASKKCLVVNCVSGLGNRLRAYASAAVLSKKMGRSLVVIWVPDVHVQAELSELFDISSSSFTVSSLDFSSQLSWINTAFYDFERTAYRPIEDSAHEIVYISSAYRLDGVTHKVQDDEFAQELSSLRPVHMIQAIVGSRLALFSKQTISIGAHIRMLGNIQQDVPGIYSVPKRNRHFHDDALPVVVRERQKCHVKYFAQAMSHILIDEMNVTFLVSSDSSEALEYLGTSFLRHNFYAVIDSPHECLSDKRRSAACLRLAVAEMIILSKTNHFLSSDWSSFSEVISALRAAQGLRSKSGCYVSHNIFASW